MQPKISIRQEKSTDYGKIHLLNIEAFARRDEADLVKRLRLTPEYLPKLALVAETEEKIVVGHIIFTKILIEGKQKTPSLALAPMAVLPDYQRMGIGSLMVKRGLTTARELGFDSVIVLGHKDYYPKFGFRPASAWGILCPIEVPDEVFMAIELQRNSLVNKPGIVKYSAAFNIK